jgi:hypothetical protein
VLGTGHARSVRLRSPDGATLTDDTAAGIVLLIADHELELPVTLEIRDQTGETIASHLDLEFQTEPTRAATSNLVLTTRRSPAANGSRAAC